MVSEYDNCIGLPISCLLTVFSVLNVKGPSRVLLSDYEKGWIVCSSKYIVPVNVPFTFLPHLSPSAGGLMSSLKLRLWASAVMMLYSQPP